MRFLRHNFSRIIDDQRGVTLVEYGIALTLALVLGTAALATLGGEISDALGLASSSMPG